MVINYSRRLFLDSLLITLFVIFYLIFTNMIQVLNLFCVSTSIFYVAQLFGEAFKVVVKVAVSVLENGMTPQTHITNLTEDPLQWVIHKTALTIHFNLT